MACEMKISETSVRRTKSELGIKTRKKVPSPKFVKDQTDRIKTKAWKLYRRIVSDESKIIVMDDETYVLCDPLQVPGNNFYNQVEGEPVDLQQKLKRLNKFPDKFLVWQAISLNGQASNTFITKGTINAKTYKKKCLLMLFKFINKLGDPEKFLF